MVIITDPSHSGTTDPDIGPSSVPDNRNLCGLSWQHGPQISTHTLAGVGPWTQTWHLAESEPSHHYGPRYQVGHQHQPVPQYPHLFITGFMFLPLLCSVLISVAHVAPKGHTDAWGLWPCWCLKAVQLPKPYQSEWPALASVAMVISGYKLLLRAMFESVALYWPGRYPRSGHPPETMLISEGQCSLWDHTDLGDMVFHWGHSDF